MLARELQKLEDNGYIPEDFKRNAVIGNILPEDRVKKIVK